MIFFNPDSESMRRIDMKIMKLDGWDTQRSFSAYHDMLLDPDRFQDEK